MFKEAFIAILCFIGIYVILRILLRKNALLAKRLIAGSLMLTLLLNIGYNTHAFFPSLVLDDTVYLGGMGNHLFIYQEDSRYHDQILFPVLQNRAVLIDESADFYALFLRTFAQKTEPLSLTDEERGTLISASDILSFSAPFRSVNLMTYAFPFFVEISEVPDVYLDQDTLSKEDTLIAVSDETGNLYLFTQKTFREVTGHHE